MSLEDDELIYSEVFADRERTEVEKKLYGLASTSGPDAGFIEETKFKKKSKTDQFQDLLKKFPPDQLPFDPKIIDYTLGSLYDLTLADTLNPEALVWAFTYIYWQKKNREDKVIEIFKNCYKTNTQIFDIVRYFRYLNEMEYTSADEEIDFRIWPEVVVKAEMDDNGKILSIKQSEPCKNKYDWTIENLKLDHSKEIEITFIDENFESKVVSFKIYQNDSPDSVVQRFSISTLGLPKNFVTFELEYDQEDKIENFNFIRGEKMIEVSVKEKRNNLALFEMKNPKIKITTPYSGFGEFKSSWSKLYLEEKKIEEKKEKDEKYYDDKTKLEKQKSDLIQKLLESMSNMKLPDFFIMVILTKQNLKLRESTDNTKKVIFETIKKLETQPLFKAIYDKTFKDLTAITFDNFYEQTLKEYRKQAKQNNDMLKVFPHIRELPAPTFKNMISNIVEERYNIRGEFNLETRIDTIELFNNISCSIDLPLASVNRFHKVLNNFSVPETEERSWMTDKNNEDLYFYIRVSSNLDIKQLHKNGLFTVDPENYASIRIKSIKDEESKSFFEISMLANNAVDKSVLLSRVFDNLNINPVNIKLEKQFGSGLFAMTKIPVPNDILFDIAMNDPVSRQMLTFDERSSIHKRGDRMTFYLRRNELLKNYESVRIKVYTKKIKKHDPEISYFPGMAKPEHNLIIFSIQGEKNIQDIEFLKNIFEKIIQRSINIHDRYFKNYYCKLISNIGNIPSLEIYKHKKSSDGEDLTMFQQNRRINPELYVPKYSRSVCQNYPKVYSQDTIKDLKRFYKSQTKEQIIESGFGAEFPKKTDIIKGIRPQFLHTCEYKDYPYIGLKENKNLPNKENYPFVPCCFEREQSNNFDAKFIYYNDKNANLSNLGSKIPKKIKEYEQLQAPSDKTLKKAKPVLDQGTYGFLNKDIESFIAMTDLDFFNGEVKYFRYGLEDSGMSVVDALMVAFYEKDFSKEEILKSLKKLVIQNCLSQSLTTPIEGLEILDRKDQYLDGLKWIDVLENVFQCNIVFWQYKEDQKTDTPYYQNEYEYDGQLTFPYYQRQLYKTKLYDKTVFIYITHGGEFSDLENPRCELIVRHKLGQKIQTIYDTNTKLIQSVYESLNKLASINVNRVLSISNPEKIKRQVSDGSGKIRQLLVEYKNQMVLVFTDPAFVNFRTSSNIDVKINTDYIYTSESVAIEILQKYFNVTNVQKIMKNGITIAITGLSSQVRVYLLVKNVYNSSLEEYDSRNFIIPLEITNSNSIFTKYSEYKRLSNVILAYTLYLFSVKYEMIKDYEGLLKRVDEFRSDNTEVDIDVKYKIVSRSFNIESDNQGIFKINKSGVPTIVFQSEKLREKLMYYLKQQIKYYPQKVQDFKFNNYVPNYYTSSKDFITGENFTVYNQKLDYEISRERTKLKSDYKVYFNFNNMISDSYFLQNENLYQNQLFIAKNYPDLSMNEVLQIEFNQKPFRFLDIVWFEGDQINRKSFQIVKIDGELDYEEISNLEVVDDQLIIGVNFYKTLDNQIKSEIITLNAYTD